VDRQTQHELSVQHAKGFDNAGELDEGATR
jgi:hypothetical protein